MPCGCKEPKTEWKEDGFVTTRIMCKEHAEEYRKSLKK